MKPVPNCRQHAEACRAMAKRAGSDEVRQYLETMAIGWDDLAKQHEKLAQYRSQCVA
jgi:hypothetical protein